MMRTKLIWLSFTSFAAVLLCAVSAFAACTTPTGNEGDVTYSGTAHIMAYCNGTNWVAMGSSTNATFGTLTTNDFCTAASGSSIQCTTAATGSGNVVLATSSTITTPTFSGTVSNGTFSGGTWNGTAIGATYGGTGINNGSNTITVGGNLSTAGSLTTVGAYGITLTAGATTALALPASGTVVATATVSPAQGDILYYNGSAWTDLAHGTNGQYLQTQGASANPQWATVTVGTGSLTGVVQTANGGTGDTTLTAGGILVGNGTGVVGAVADVATGSVLISGGAGSNPAYSSSPTISGANITSMNGSNISSGTVSASYLPSFGSAAAGIVPASGGGTTNFLRADGTWAAASSSMVYPGSGIPNSTGSAWGTSYTTSGTGTVLALTASPTFTGTVVGAVSAWSSSSTSTYPIAATGAALGTALNNTTNLLSLSNSNSNSNYLNFQQIRTTAGTAWTTATTRIQNVTDVTNQAYIDFNPVNGNNALAFGDAGNEYMRITSGGNVGIGATSPSAKLDVIGGAIEIGASDFTPNASLHINTAYGGNGRLTQMSAGGGGALNIMSGDGTNWWSWGVSSSNSWTINSGTSFGSGGLTILSGGNVGIGTTSPGATLDVAGTGNFTGTVNGATPTASNNLATKAYVDTAVASAGGSGGNPSNFQAFTSSGTWTKPGSGSMAYVQCWGGGGGGGGGYTSGGSGGGAGGEAYAWFPLSSLSSSVTVTVGNGGSAGAASGGAGGAGGNTTFGSYLTAAGGSGGGGNGGANGTGGAGSGTGVAIVRGSNGEGGHTYPGSSANGDYGAGGTGGDSGGSGSGGNGGNGPASAAGAGGGSGECVVTTY